MQYIEFVTWHKDSINNALIFHSVFSPFLFLIGGGRLNHSLTTLLPLLQHLLPLPGLPLHNDLVLILQEVVLLVLQVDSSCAVCSLTVIRPPCYFLSLPRSHLDLVPVLCKLHG